MENNENENRNPKHTPVIDFRSFVDLKKKEVITVRVVYNSMVNVKMKRVTKFKGQLSNLLTNYFNYPENKKFLEDIRNDEELEFKIIDIAGN